MADRQAYAHLAFWTVLSTLDSLLSTIWKLGKATNTSSTRKQPHNALTPARATTAIGFQSLPRELRDQIYSYAVIDDDPIYLCLANNYRTTTHCDFYHDKDPSEKRYTAHSLFRTSRQIRAEVQDLFFKRNSFEIYFTFFSPVRKHRMPGRICASILRHVNTLQVATCAAIDHKFALSHENGATVVTEGWTEADIDHDGKSGEAGTPKAGRIPVKMTAEMLARIQEGFSGVDLANGFNESLIRDLDNTLFHGHQEEVGRDLASYDFTFGKRDNMLADYEEESPPGTAEECWCEECNM